MVNMNSQVITVIGDGQLARMMQPEASELGISLRVLTSSDDSPAAQVIPDAPIGDYKNFDDVYAAAQGCSALTFDHEHVPNDILEELLAKGINVEPRPTALIHAQDKLVMRKKLRELGAPVPPFAAINSVEDAHEFWVAVAGRVCLKACRGGYDGHGVWFPKSEEEFKTLVGELLEKNTPLMAEKKVALKRELSAMVARNPQGQVQPWPVVESVQHNGICFETIAPAPDIDEKIAKEAQELAIHIAENLGVTGALAVELFETVDFNGQPEIFVNELAMRPHNTGHWTQEGSVTSQFEQHLRAVANLPLGSTELLSPYTVMVNILGGEENPELSFFERMKVVWEKYPNAKIHLYGKEWRPGRKLGHVNVSGADLDEVRESARQAAFFMVHAKWDVQ